MPDIFVFNMEYTLQWLGSLKNVPYNLVIIMEHMLQWDEELARLSAEKATSVTSTKSDANSDTSSSSAVTSRGGCCGRGTCCSRSNGDQAPEASSSNLSNAATSVGVDGSDLAGGSSGVVECANAVKKVRIGGRTAKPNLLDF